MLTTVFEGMHYTTLIYLNRYGTHLSYLLRKHLLLYNDLLQTQATIDRSCCYLALTPLIFIITCFLRQWL